MCHCNPAGFEPDAATVELARSAGAGSKITISNDPMDAVRWGWGCLPFMLLRAKSAVSSVSVGSKVSLSHDPRNAIRWGGAV